MQVHQHSDPSLFGVAEDPVDPLRVLGCRHSPLHVRPSCFHSEWAVRSLARWIINEIPIAQRQAYHVEAQSGHLHKVILLDVFIQKPRHTNANVLSADITEAQGARAVGLNSTLEEILVGAGEPQKMLWDEPPTIADTAYAAVSLRLRLTALGDADVARIAPHSAGPRLPPHVPEVSSTHHKSIVSNHICECCLSLTLRYV
mmetsp:Transcript_154608/g.274191  ORF Transcript_154608/g.274191 Transcript_154608/m.274191 type:complete len:201 (+) Transcript_154608:586-1188(+)